MADSNKNKRKEEELRVGTAPVYEGRHEAELEKAYEAIARRPAFSYDMAADPIYRQYKADYADRGRKAMKDSMDRAAALTGGYGSSYAQTVGQQQYDEHLSGLAGIVPELYQLAYSKYSAEGDRLSRQYDALERLRDEEYERYQDQLDRYEEGRRLEYEREQERRAYEEKQAEQSYTRKLNEAATLAKYGDFSGYAEIYGQETAENMKKSYIAANPGTAYNMGLIDAAGYYAMTGNYAPGHSPAVQGSRSSGGYYPSTAPDGRDAAAVQRELRSMGYNIAVDGAWGPKSQAAWEKAYGGGAPVLSSDPSGLFRV